MLRENFKKGSQRKVREKKNHYVQNYKDKSKSIVLVRNNASGMPVWLSH